MKKPTNYPRGILLQKAVAYTKQFGHEKVEIYFKFTCEKCGERCMFQVPNVLFERGTCHVCGHDMEVKEGGFAAHITIGQKPFGESPSSSQG